MSISTMNDDLNILQNLAIPAFEEDVDVIQKLDDEPNDVGGLSAAELKAKFDEAGNRIKTYLNETLVPSISETVAEAEKRAEAEAARVLAEEQRVTAEQARVSSEAEREQAEAERRAGEAERAAAEAERKTAEDARVLAEQKREDTDSGIVAQATSAAEAAENAANKAASAAIHQPIVGDNGNWHTWSFDAGAYVDTGIYAGGDAPYIGENGNWYVGQTDTGVAATSSGVYVGSGNMPGGYNLQIDPEGEETDIIPYIGPNGHWFLGDTDLNVSATGPTGPVGEKGDMGPAGPAGSDGQDGVDGKSAYQYAVEGGYTGTEEAFAAKLAEEIPTALPNPNALTFTGAVTGRYDGSAPLEVEIPSGGGSGEISATARNLLITILRNGVYSSDQNANITDLETALGGSDAPVVKSYAITNTLTNCTTNNAVTSVTDGGSYTATLTAADGYALNSVVVTMGGTDITSTAYSGSVITIASVTGDVSIVATAVAAEPGGGETVVNLFDKDTMVVSGAFVGANGAISTSATSKYAKIPISVGTYALQKGSGWAMSTTGHPSLIDSAGTVLCRFANLRTDGKSGSPSEPTVGTIAQETNGNGIAVTVLSENVTHIIFSICINGGTDDTDTTMMEVGDTCHDYVAHV